MTPPIRPEAIRIQSPESMPPAPRPLTGNARLDTIRKLTAGYAAQGATPEHIQEIIATEHPDLVSTPEQELAATPLSTGENIGGAARALYQGASFNFGDELMGTVRAGLSRIPGGDDPQSVEAMIADERKQQARFRTAHPKTALGLEIAGGIGTGLGAAKAVGGLGAGAGRLLATGAGSGAIAGAGAGETGNERLGGAALGAGLGAGLGYVGGKIAASRAGDAVARGSRNLLEMLAEQGGNSGQDIAGAVVRELPGAQQYPGLTTFADKARTVSIPAQRAATRALHPDPKTGFATQRNLLDILEQQGMGGEALAMNVGDDQTVRAVRAAANQPGSTAGQTVNERLARQGGAIGEQVPQDIGAATGLGNAQPEVALRDMQSELSRRVKTAYDDFAAQGDIGPLAVDDAVAQEFAPFVATVRRNPELAALPETDARVQMEAFHLLQEQLRRSARGESAVNTRSLKELRDRVLEGLDAVDPNFGRVTRQYALDQDVGKNVQDAFTQGGDLASGTPGAATVAMDAASAAEQKALQAGHASALMGRAGGRSSNADLGEFSQFRDVARAVIGSPKDRQRFIAIHGQDAYDSMLARLMPKIKAAAQNAAARGNSTTTKQLLDALAFGDDATLDALSSLAAGSPGSAISRFAGKTLVGPLDRAYRLGVGKTAGETADLLTTQGTGNIRSLLDFLEAAGVRDAQRQTVGAVAGGSSVPGQRNP